VGCLQARPVELRTGGPSRRSSSRWPSVGTTSPQPELEQLRGRCCSWRPDRIVAAVSARRSSPRWRPPCSGSSEAGGADCIPPARSLRNLRERRPLTRGRPSSTTRRAAPRTRWCVARRVFVRRRAAGGRRRRSRGGVRLWHSQPPRVAVATRAPRQGLEFRPHDGRVHPLDEERPLREPAVCAADQILAAHDARPTAPSALPRGAGCSTTFGDVADHTGIDLLPSGSRTSSHIRHSCSCRGLAISIQVKAPR